MSEMPSPSQMCLRGSGNIIKSCAASEITTCFCNIKNPSSLADADIKAVWCFEDLSFYRTNAIHQHFVSATP